MIKQAVILAAGLGTRLKPYTDTMPKPMIPILEKPLLEWTILQFKKHGITEFFIALHYLPDVIQDHFGDGSAFGVKIKYHIDPLEYETGGRIKQFESELDDEFFIIYGDMMSLLDYAKMEADWRIKPADAIGMQRVGRSEHYADVDVAELDSDGRFIATHAKPHTERYESAYRMRGVFISRKNFLSYIKDKTDQIGKDVLPRVVSAGEKFYGYECDDYSKGIDTVEKWKEVEDFLRKNEIKPLGQ